MYLREGEGGGREGKQKEGVEKGKGKKRGRKMKEEEEKEEWRIMGRKRTQGGLLHCSPETTWFFPTIGLQC